MGVACFLGMLSKACGLIPACTGLPGLYWLLACLLGLLGLLVIDCDAWYGLRAALVDWLAWLASSHGFALNCLPGLLAQIFFHFFLRACGLVFMRACGRFGLLAQNFFFGKA